MKNPTHISCVIILILWSSFAFTQENRKAHLHLEDPDLRYEHSFKANRKIFVWINDSVSYSGYFKIQDSIAIQLDDTLIQVADISQIHAKNRRRSIGASAVILSPLFAGFVLEGLLLYYDDSFFSYFPIPSLSGMGGSILGVLTATCFMEKKTYAIDENAILKIEGKRTYR